MNEVTKECIRRDIRYCEGELRQVQHYIGVHSERLSDGIKKQNELLEQIKQLKEDLGEETTE